MDPRSSPWYLLRNLANAKVRMTPYPLLYIDDCLPEEQYHELVSQFPNLPTKEHEHRQQTIHQLLQDPVEFLHVNSSNEFLEDILQVWKAKPQYQEPIHIRTQWTMQTPPHENDYQVREMHIDKENKVFNGFLYTPREGDIYGGDFQVFAPYPGQIPVYRKNRVVNTYSMRHVDTIEYKPNRFLAFLNEPCSIHSVSTRNGSLMPRQSINVLGERI